MHIFDPFVSTKIEGTGLGLALVAKLTDDHGGIIDLESDHEWDNVPNFTAYVKEHQDAS